MLGGKWMKDGCTPISILLVLVIGLTSFGCNSLEAGGDTGGVGGGPGGAGGAGGVATAMLRVVHLAVGVPEVDATRLDFTVVDEGSFNGIAFGRASQPATLPSGMHSLDVTEPGGGQLLASVTWELEADGRYTVVAYRDSSESTTTGLMLFDGSADGLAIGSGRVLMGHGADDSTWAMVDVVDSDANEVLAAGLVLGSQTEAIDLAAGEHELGFSVASPPPAIDKGPFPIDVSADETLVIIVVDGDVVDQSVDATVYILGPDTTGMVPAIPLG